MHTAGYSTVYGLISGKKIDISKAQKVTLIEIISTWKTSPEISATHPASGHTDPTTCPMSEEEVQGYRQFNCIVFMQMVHFRRTRMFSKDSEVLSRASSSSPKCLFATLRLTFLYKEGLTHPERLFFREERGACGIYLCDRMQEVNGTFLSNPLECFPRSKRWLWYQNEPTIFGRHQVIIPTFCTYSMSQKH